MTRPSKMSWTPQTGIYMDPHYNLVYPKGATHLDGIDKETMEVIDEHWGQFPPQHPLINHIVGICFLFLWLINLFGNGSVCYIFLKVYNIQYFSIISKLRSNTQNMCHSACSVTQMMLIIR